MYCDLPLLMKTSGYKEKHAVFFFAVAQAPAAPHDFSNKIVHFYACTNMQA